MTIKRKASVYFCWENFCGWLENVRQSVCCVEVVLANTWTQPKGFYLYVWVLSLESSEKHSWLILSWMGQVATSVCSWSALWVLCLYRVAFGCWLSTASLEVLHVTAPVFVVTSHIWDLQSHAEDQSSFVKICSKQIVQLSEVSFTSIRFVISSPCKNWPPFLGYRPHGMKKFPSLFRYECGAESNLAILSSSFSSYPISRVLSLHILL